MTTTFSALNLLNAISMFMSQFALWRDRGVKGKGEVFEVGMLLRCPGLNRIEDEDEVKKPSPKARLIPLMNS
jgi:hypothetical protein